MAIRQINKLGSGLVLPKSKQERKVKQLRKPAIALVALLVFASVNVTVMVNIPKAEAQGPTLQVSKAYGLNVTGTTLLVNITIDGVAELGGWSIDLKWDPNITQVSMGDRNGLSKKSRTGLIYYNIYEGGLMRNASSTNFLVNAVNNTGGTLTALASFFKEVGNSVAGSGTLALINFTLINVGTTTINVTQSTIQDRAGITVDHTTENGLITNQPPPPPPPFWTNPLFQTGVILFFVIVVLPTVVIVRLRGKAPLTEKDIKEIEEYKEETEGEPLTEESQETSTKA
jgi:hypothetical protein